MTDSQPYEDLLARIYDEDNPDGPDHDFYRELADEESAKNLLDLGRGTGILTVTFAQQGRSIVGIDPSESMLNIARERPQESGIEWRIGTSQNIETNRFDFAILSGNAVMHILGEDWHNALADIARGLKKGGTLAFETRNPEAKAWESWGHEKYQRQTWVGFLEETASVTQPDQNGVVCLKSENFFVTQNLNFSTVLRLQFRTYKEISSQLEEHGFGMNHVYSQWDKTEFVPGSQQPLMIFVCTKL